jgi:hypothetical protein
MPQRCTVCAHPERAAIDGQIIASDALRRIAADHRVSEAAVRRHKKHMAQAVAEARAELLPAVAERLEAQTLVLIGAAVAGQLLEDARQLFMACMASSHIDGALGALYARIKALEVAHAVGALQPSGGPGSPEDMAQVVARPLNGRSGPMAMPGRPSPMRWGRWTDVRRCAALPA